MSGHEFIAKAWTNSKQGCSGASFGLKISAADRDRFFERAWRSVTLRLEAGEETIVAEVNCAKASFWDGTCRELIGKEIGLWFIDNGFAPWLSGEPPEFRMIPVGSRTFAVRHAGD